MDLLLDSHAALWWADNVALLSSDAAEAISDPANDVWASAASAWEMAIKTAQGKLAVDVRVLFHRLADRGIRVRGIGVEVDLWSWAVVNDSQTPNVRRS